ARAVTGDGGGVPRGRRACRVPSFPGTVGRRPPFDPWHRVERHPATLSGRRLCRGEMSVRIVRSSACEEDDAAHYVTRMSDKEEAATSAALWVTDSGPDRQNALRRPALPE